MHFDAAEALAAFAPPSYTHRDGAQFVGRHLSLLEWLRFQGEIEAMAHGKLGLLRLMALYRRLLDAWFPPPPRRWLLGRRTGPRVADLVLELPVPVQSQVIGRFLHSQARALSLPAPAFGSTSPMEPATTSPPSPLTPTTTAPATTGSV